MDIHSVLSEYQDDIQAVEKEVKSIYASSFASHFESVDELYRRMQNKTHPITDAELEDVLTVLPLQLYAVSETLNTLKLKMELVRLKNKETREGFLRQRSTEAADIKSATAADRKEYVNRLVAIDMQSYELVIQIYQAVIDIVSGRIQFSKELIMGCKKIWDGRRHTEQTMPVSPVNPTVDQRVSVDYDTTGSRFRRIYG